MPLWSGSSEDPLLGGMGLCLWWYMAEYNGSTPMTTLGLGISSPSSLTQGI